MVSYYIGHMNVRSSHYDASLVDLLLWPAFISSIGEVPLDTGACQTGHHLDEVLFSICSASFLENNYINPETIFNYWAWFTWAYCISWLCLCIFGKIDYKHWNQQTQWIVTSFARSKSIDHMIHNYMAYIWPIMFATVWASCFALQFYLFSDYFRHSLISYT